jgi:hypothetical protein
MIVIFDYVSPTVFGIILFIQGQYSMVNNVCTKCSKSFSHSSPLKHQMSAHKHKKQLPSTECFVLFLWMANKIKFQKLLGINLRQHLVINYH